MTDYEGMTADQLRSLAGERGLPTGGTKSELVARLVADDADAAAAAAPEVGDLVAVLAGDGTPTRVGFVVGEGRRPDPDAGESAEPLVLWLPGSPAPYGGPLTALT